MLALRNSYHGRVVRHGRRHRQPRLVGLSLTPFNVHYVHGGYRYRSPFRDLSDADYIEACVDDLRDVIDTTDRRRRGRA